MVECSHHLTVEKDDLVIRPFRNGISRNDAHPKNGETSPASNHLNNEAVLFASGVQQFIPWGDERSFPSWYGILNAEKSRNCPERG